MNRIDRLTAIILLLQGGKRTASEIARRFEVSKRTVFRDIEALCEMGIPIPRKIAAHVVHESRKASPSGRISVLVADGCLTATTMPPSTF